MWRLNEAHSRSDQAKAASVKAAADVTAQRSGIVSLVTESYQNGTEINTATALMSDEGPDGLMNRYAVVQSAGDSMQARYDRFRAALAIAKVYAAKAQKAEKRQQAMAEEAHDLAVEAGKAVAETGVITNQIAAQKRELVDALVAAQDKSTDLAQQRQDGLEKIAAEKAAALAEARRKQAELAQQQALKKAAADAKKEAKAAQVPKSTDNRGTDGSDRDDDAHIVLPTPVPPVVVNPAPNNAVAVQRAIAYARTQLGKPYLWAAAGPYAFDCSGLTMQAWARGGKLLPHYSVAQYSQSRPISMADLKPGDLLFWSNNGSPSGIHHVALYIGGGQYIEAPYTGAYVRYSTLTKGHPDFAARP
jgi:cell wall-associated NlpC family hydrolase